jgi:hypothetical protein
VAQTDDRILPLVGNFHFNAPVNKFKEYNELSRLPTNTVSLSITGEPTIGPFVLYFQSKFGFVSKSGCIITDEGNINWQNAWLHSTRNNIKILNLMMWFI